MTVHADCRRIQIIVMNHFRDRLTKPVLYQVAYQHLAIDSLAWSWLICDFNNRRLSLLLFKKETFFP